MYAQKGQIQIFVRGNSYLADNIRSALQKNYVNFVDNASAANLVIDVSMNRGQFQQYKENIETQNLHENLRVGSKQVADEHGNMVNQDVYKDFYFKKYSVKTVNEAEMMAEVHTRGLYALNRNYRAKTTSSQTYYWFDGNVPKKYTAYTEGKLLAREEQFNQTRQKLWSQMSGDFYEMNRILATQ